VTDAWFAVPHFGGKTPLLYAIDHGTPESFAATAHEMGHCCNSAFLARQVGPMSAFDAAIGFSEVPALLFEIAALDQALLAAGSAHEARARRCALIEQALHFLSALPMQSEFERRCFAEDNPDLTARWADTKREFLPDVVQVMGGDDDFLLTPTTGAGAFAGEQYAIAYSIAFWTYKNPGSGYKAFEREGAYQPIAPLALRHLGLDIQTGAGFELCVEHIERMLDEQEKMT
jgi:oligoendopeptidase F